MSNTANWSYTNVATVYPHTGYDGENNVDTYGAPYLIKCTWKDEVPNALGSYIDSLGVERVRKTTFYTEDNRIKQSDFIVKGDKTSLQLEASNAEKVEFVLEYDMSVFGEIPDYEVVT
jgi:hypothetical protein